MKTKLLMLALTSCISVGAMARGGNEMITAQEIIRKLDLKPLPDEGGFYRQTYKRENEQLPAKYYGIDSDSKRSVSTAIYYLVTPESFSALHRVKSDEIFHFYGGDPVEMIQIDEEGNVQKFVIGSDIMSGQQPQVVVPKGVWQALKLRDGGQWALMGTTVAPGFEFEDFELGHRNEMLNQFPQHHELVNKYTR